MKLLLLSLTFLLSGCASQINHLASGPDSSTLVLESIPLNARNLPDFSRQLETRPAKPGAIYHLAIMQQQRVTSSHEIAVTPAKQADFDKPLEVVYEWTGKGFVAGLETVANANDIDELAVVFALPLLGAVAGFAIGIVASVPETYKELEHLLTTSREVLVSQTDYRYDANNRISIMEKHLPGRHGQKLVRTEFHYYGTEQTPYQVIVYSYPEDKERILKPSGI